eukprot:6632509-Pyramimonas_sp.AAC.1
MSRLLSLAAPILAQPPKDWGSVRGPLAAAILSLRRIGWGMHAALAFVDQAGEHWPLTMFSPKFLESKMKAAWQGVHLHVVSQKLGLEAGANVDLSVARQ